MSIFVDAGLNIQPKTQPECLVYLQRLSYVLICEILRERGLLSLTSFEMRRFSDTVFHVLSTKDEFAMEVYKLLDTPLRLILEKKLKRLVLGIRRSDDIISNRIDSRDYLNEAFTFYIEYGNEAYIELISADGVKIVDRLSYTDEGSLESSVITAIKQIRLLSKILKPYEQPMDFHFRMFTEDFDELVNCYDKVSHDYERPRNNGCLSSIILPFGQMLLDFESEFFRNDVLSDKSSPNKNTVMDLQRSIRESEIRLGNKITSTGESRVQSRTERSTLSPPSSVENPRDLCLDNMDTMYGIASLQRIDDSRNTDVENNVGMQEFRSSKAIVDSDSATKTLAPAMDLLQSELQRPAVKNYRPMKRQMHVVEQIEEPVASTIPTVATLGSSSISSISFCERPDRVQNIRTRGKGIVQKQLKYAQRNISMLHDSSMEMSANETLSGDQALEVVSNCSTTTNCAFVNLEVENVGAKENRAQNIKKQSRLYKTWKCEDSLKLGKFEARTTHKIKKAQRKERILRTYPIVF